MQQHNNGLNEISSLKDNKINPDFFQNSNFSTKVTQSIWIIICLTFFNTTLTLLFSARIGENTRYLFYIFLKYVTNNNSQISFIFVKKNCVEKP